ncbi:ABC transporter ATP-binding protein [Thermomicrobium sp. 4228-Ro]|uniref:ABC transporter ATP-binding protein n=1 Tax=Thermomicrobium sp. 4228-Ro TaxID=2993937 RepID=UPI002248B065|nr:ABC transporter ATP-binding protein [Thermomicrobium sp. 4228-Ro]MCX2727349.1 ABC transporter ATP-binding protein [Thermomicrobium sp. 4228-Ro]
MEREPLVRIDRVSKIYRDGRREVVALHEVSLTIQPGEWVAIVGPSGCGKSTLLNLVAGLDRPTAGRVRVAGVDLGALDEEALARWRRCTVGIVFQFFQLLPTLTALENVQLPMVLEGRAGASRRARELLEMVGLGHVAHRLPSELSGGERQRVAIARALANDPLLLLADEPTGNLDSETGAVVLELFERAWRTGTTIVLVTHDMDIATRAQRIVQLRDGKVVGECVVVPTQ